MNPYKKLGGQALIYGLGNIVPRVLNYAVLTFYYTRKFQPETYGIITELYAYVAILMVVLTYGMETGLFRFSTDKQDRNKAYSSVLGSVITTSFVFAVVVYIFRKSIAELIGYNGNPEYIVYLGWILALDAVCAIVFARLRIENKVRRFAIIKIFNVVTTVFFVFLFLEIIPSLPLFADNKWYQQYFAGIGVGYVFLANLIASFLVLVVQLPDLRSVKIYIDWSLLKKILFYSLPLLISGLAGIFNESIDRILLRKFSAENMNSLYELGIYGANYRIAVIMTIFVQMFRYAAEPFFFNMSNNRNATVVYANVLKYFTIFLMTIFLGVALGIDFFKLFIDPDYYEGLGIVPVVLMANVLVGLLFNVNMWYKLSGHTMYGVYITGIGAFLTIALNIVFIPYYGYYACAWIHLITNGVMLILTYYYGQKIFKINYDLLRIGQFITIGLILYFLGYLIKTEIALINMAVAVVIVGIYFIYCNKKENLVGIFIKKNEG